MNSGRFRAAAAAIVVLSLTGMAACGKKVGGPPPGGFPAPQVTVATVAPRTVAVPYEFTGRIEGSREVEVRARVAGILLRRTYDEGRPVTKGQSLFQIDPANYRAELQAAEAALAQAKAAEGRSARDVSRLEPLLAAHATSKKDYDNAVSDLEEAKAGALSAQARVEQARLDLTYTRVEAPISGLSSRAEHSEGSLVGPSGDAGVLTHISQVRPIWVRFSNSDQGLLTLRKGIAAKTITSPGTDALEVELVLPDGSVHPERGKVNFSDSQIDSSTGSVGLRAEVANAAGTLIPGQFVRVRLLGIERPNAILVPQRAVQQGPQGKFVFVVGADNKAEARPVTVGDWQGQDWIVESGLAAGDRVIVDGVVKVQPGAPVVIVDPNAPPAGAPGTPGAPSTGGN
ncbi:MAG: efflux RND transporter periplasmic adaptor subunit [Acidobacteriota bacterium]